MSAPKTPPSQPSGIKVTVDYVSEADTPIIATGTVDHEGHVERFTACVWPGDTQYVDLYRNGNVVHRSGIASRGPLIGRVIDAIAAEVERAWSNR